ncbi:putative ABC transport system substrate-binding protein [Malonomonas rubra DSM 5091]|uniref:Putative ABC transport system substrate-binding protein n=1 Tax=Malonomonas rubra DSM 5091 TaxID=1122189 RepID=A0A1M6K0R6_MALRU|nr:ABC transporter substrate-binding protein [Malonomonas rubra]SHJ52508.1 putative ABC transport system substrate-binding protein [Malonomonas rubra DSM 5091]
MKRILFLAGLFCLILAQAGLAAGYTVSFNQIVEHPALDATRQGVKDELKEQGFNVQYHDHIAQGNIATANLIAKQILGEQPDVAVGIATPTAQACAQVLKEIPVVFGVVTDPVGAGLVQSLEKPGGNVTGTSDMSPIDRQLELILEFMPNLKNLGVIYNSGEANSVTLVRVLKEEASKRNIQVEEATVSNSAGVFQAAKSLIGRSEAVYIPTDNTVVSAFEAITQIGYQAKLPIFAADVDSVARGAIAALAVDYYLMGRQTGEMVARVLKGAKPAEMPVETLREFQIHLNPGSAAQMGVQVPEAILKKADKIIE